MMDMLSKVKADAATFRIAALATAVLLLLLTASAASAATITVDDSGGADYTTIQAAVDAESERDTIEVQSGTYVENVDVGNATPLNFSETIAGTIDVPGEMDNYTFSAQAGDQIIARIGSSWSYHAQLQLYAPNGTLIDEDYGYRTCILEITLTDTGIYTLLASDKNGDDTGDYGIFLQRINNPVNATPLGFGETVAGNTTQRAEMDAYTFTGEAGDHIVVRMGSEAFNPELRLYAPNGILITKTTAHSSEFATQLTDTGTFTLLAGDIYGIDTGEYGVFLQRNNNPSNATPLGFGETIAETIDNFAEMDTYTIQGEAGDHIFIQIASIWYGSEIRVYAPNGTLLETKLGSSCVIATPLPEKGTYTLLVGSYNWVNTGNYSIYVQRTSNPVNATSIEFGQTIEGTIEVPFEKDTYTFYAEAEDQIIIRMQASWWYYLGFKLFAPNGTLIGSGYDQLTQYSELALHLPDTGNYTVLAEGTYEDSAGEYWLHLQRTSNPVNATPLSYGESIEGNITQYAEMDAYTFTAETGDHIFARAGGSFDPELRLYNPNGTLISSVTGVQVGLTELLVEAGNYTFLMGGGDGDDTGEYAVFLQRTSSPVNAKSIELSETVSGNITQPVEMNSFIFSGDAGDQIFTRMGSSWWYFPKLRLYGPNGTFIETHDQYDPGFYELTATLPETGTYTLLAGDMIGEDTGDYSIYLQRIPNPVNATSLAFGDTINGTITHRGEMDTYVFTAQTMVKISAMMGSSWLGPELQLYAPDGTLIDKKNYNGYDCELSSIVPYTGTYILLVGDSYISGDFAGEYTLSLEATLNHPLSIGKTDSYNISPHTWNYFYLTVLEGENLLMQVEPSDPAGELEIYGAFERLPTKNDFDYAELVKNPHGIYDLLISPTKSGTYYFGVYSSNNADNLSYTITPSLGDQYISRFFPDKVTNSSNTRIHVYGQVFTNDMCVELRKNTTTIPAQMVFTASSTICIAHFDLTSAAFGIYDLAIIWPDGTERVLNSSVEITEMPQGVIFIDPECTILKGITYSYDIEVPETDRLYITLQKTSFWSGIMSVLYNEEIIASKGNYYDTMVQIVDPEPGVYTVNITAGQTGSALLTVWTDLPELPLEEWIVDTIYNSCGSIWYQVDVPSDQDSLFFQGEAIGVSSHFDIYYNIYEGPQHWVSSYSPYTSLEIPNPHSGTYIVEFFDSAWVFSSIEKTYQSRDVLIKASLSSEIESPPTYLPLITGVTPEQAGNTGLATVEIQGIWLDPNATVSLSRSGNETINAVEVDRESDSTSLFATFNLADCELGVRSFQVTNPDGQNATAPVPFMVEEGGNSELWFEIVGREKIRTGRPATYFLNYGNNGTLDMPAPLFTLSISSASSQFQLSINSSDWHYVDEPASILGSGPLECPDILPAGYSNSIPFRIRSNEDSDFSLQVTPLTGDLVFILPTLSSTIDAFCSAPGIALKLKRVYQNRYSSYLGPYGYGWVHSYDMQLEELIDGNIAIKHGDSYSVIFSNNGTDIFTPIEPGQNTVLRKNPDNTYILEKLDGSTVSFRSDLLLDAIGDTNGNSVSMTYNFQDQLVGIQHSCGEHFCLEYNGNGRASRLVDHAGREILYTYDTTGNLLDTVTAPDGSVTSYDYTAQKDTYALSFISIPGGTQLHTTYDGNGHPVETYFNEKNYLIHTSYDVSSRTTQMTDATGSSSLIRFNEFGSILWRENPLGAVTYYRYDKEHNLIELSQPMGNTYHFEYDEKGNLLSLNNPLGYEIEMDYEPAFNKLDWVRDAGNNLMDFDYDDDGNRGQITYPDSSKVIITYDSTGNPVAVTTRKADNISFTYNQRGQITRREYPNGSWTAYTYDDAGNIITAEDPNGTITMEYNLRDQLTHISYPSGHWLNYTYDDAGRLVQQTDQDNNIQIYEYNTLGQFIRLSDGTGALIVQYDYDIRGYLSRKSLGNGGNTTYEYDSAGQLINLVNYNMTGSVLSRFDYTYDLNGNPVLIETLEDISQLVYDSTGQLTGITYPDGHSVSYSYDAAGNRISVIDDGVTTSYETNNMNQYTTAGSTTFEYDLNGNLISETTNGENTTYEYDPLDRLVKVTSSDGTWEYEYDALGNRNGIKHNGTEHWYLIDPMGLGDVLAEYDEYGNLTARYIHGFGLISQIDASGNRYYYHFDPTGHTMEITNGDGDIVNEYLYAPFGEYIKKDEGIRNSFTYVGKYGVMDDGNGLLFMRMRYYLPDLGRFGSEDPLMFPGQNSYTYVENDPVSFIDPTGESLLDFLMPLYELYDALEKGRETGESMKEFQREWESIIEYDRGELSPEEFEKEQHEAGKRRGKLRERVHPPIETGLNKDSDDEDPNNKKPRPNDKEKKSGSTVGSRTPEDKYGPAGFDLPDTPSNESNRFVLPNQHFHYRVDFWNHEDATAPACDVYIYDDLETTLNRSTFHFTEIGFLNWTIPLEPCQYFNIDINTQPEMDLIVNVEGILDSDTGRINVTYRSLDPATWETPEDPMAGFLPPITESGYEIGWVCFAADAVPGLPTGTEVRNQAWVNFDGVGPTNPAPKEGPWTNTIDAGKPSSSVTATLVNQTEIHLSITGMDDAGGSGILDYTIYASMDGGNYQPWLNHIVVNETIVNGLPGHTYSFYSVAEDLVGHNEEAPIDADTTVICPAAPGYTIELYPGWNLISIPLVPENTGIASVLSPINGNYSIVWAYNASDTADHWKKHDPSVPFGNDLTTMEPGNGYWILMTSGDTFAINRKVPASTDIDLETGWNLIGYNSLVCQPITDALSSIDGNYSIIWAYNANDTTDHWKKYDPNAPFGNDLFNMEPGKGYWIMMTSDDLLKI